MLSGIKACIFDAYGTLFNVHAAAAKCRDQLEPHADRLSALWRQKQLEYTWLRSLMKAHVDFWQITGDGLDFAMETCGLSDAALRARLMEIYRTLDAYEEVHDVLARLRAGGMRTAILSNGSADMLASAVRGAGIDGALDAVLSIDDVGIFKPDPRTYQLAVERLDCAADKICFMSSNAWDVAGAAHFGFQVVWVNRFGQGRDVVVGAAELERAGFLEVLGLDQKPSAGCPVQQGGFQKRRLGGLAFDAFGGPNDVVVGWQVHGATVVEERQG